jgi:glutamine synthetase
LAALRAAVHADPGETALAEAEHAAQELLPAMEAVRAAADTLEGIVADDLWPLPTYQEMLYIL